MDRKLLSKAIIGVINGIIDDSDYQVIIADQSAPRPKGAYGSVKIITSLQETLESVQYGETSGYLSSSQQRLMVSFNFFRDGSFDKAMLVRKAFWRQNVADQLQTIGLGLSQRGAVENLTESLEAVFEERANFVCVFNYVEVDYESEYVQDIIEKATINGTVNDISMEIKIEES